MRQLHSKISSFLHFRTLTSFAAMIRAVCQSFFRVTTGPMRLALDLKRQCDIWMTIKSTLFPSKGFPRSPAKHGDLEVRVSPSQWLHENWPFRTDMSETCLLSRISEDIFREVYPDNGVLDREYGLCISDFGYY